MTHPTTPYARCQEPHLGLATTDALLREIEARIEVHMHEIPPMTAARRLRAALTAVPGALDYSTVGQSQSDLEALS